ncbi:hypothetical protein [Jatrophihabitans fulvus]
MTPGEQALASVGLDIPSDERDALLAAHDTVRAMCESLLELELDDVPPLTLPA